MGEPLSRSTARELRCAVAIAAACVMVASCALRSYEARPLVPDASARAYEAHSLGDPELAAFARNNLPDTAEFPPATWDFESLTQVALFERAELDTARAEAAVARAAVRTAGARNDPTLAFDLEAVPGEDSPWVFGWVLDLPIETAGKRGLKKRVARERADIADFDLYATAWRIRDEVRVAVAELTAAQVERGALEVEAHALADRLADGRVRFEAGSAPRFELAAIEAEREQIVLAVEAAHSRADRALAALALAVGVPVAALRDIDVARIAFDATLEVPTADRAREIGLASRIDLRRSLAEYAVAESELRLAVARQYPDITLGPGSTWDQGSRKFVLGFSLPLPIFGQQGGLIDEAEARRAAAAARFDALQEHAIGTIELTRTNYSGARRELAAARNALALALAAEQRANAGVAAGAVGRASAIDARLARARAERAALVAGDMAWRAQGELERELQQPLARPLVREVDPMGPRADEVR